MRHYKRIKHFISERERERERVRESVSTEVPCNNHISKVQYLCLDVGYFLGHYEAHFLVVSSSETAVLPPTSH